MPNYLSKLNPEQLRAVQSVSGYNFVLAGAGSGKTSVLVARIAYMLSIGIKPENILLITFTNKAAKEMKDRVIRLLGDDGKLVTACTFHSFCANVLRKYGQFVSVANDFVVLDDSDRDSAMTIAKEDYFDFCTKRNMPIETEDFPTNNELFRVYEMITNNCSTIDDVISKIDSRCNSFRMKQYKDDIVQVLNRFNKYKREHGALDYDDLLVYVEKLFRQNGQIRANMDKQYTYIMCDEYQDTNPIQNNIINLISQDYPNLMVVGDDNQSIYAFRYADINNILGFKDAHPGCKEFMLTENYRSTQEILDTANAVMFYAKEGIEKILHGQRHGKRPEMIIVNEPNAEARWILNDIKARKIPLHEVAVICRSGRQSWRLEAELNKQHIPFNKYGGQKFMEKSVIKDLLAFLRVLHSLKDEIAIARILQMYPGVGAQSAKKLAKQIAENGLVAIDDPQWQKKSFYLVISQFKLVMSHLLTLDLHDQLDYLVHDYYFQVAAEAINNSKKKESAKIEEHAKLKKSIEDAESLMEMTASYKSISSFLADVVLEATHKNEDTTDKLNITTIHSAKGLQYHTVYLMDCIEGVTPRCSSRSPEDPEELRCVYVAITRAKERLVLMVPSYMPDSEGQYRPTELSHFFDFPRIKKTLDTSRALH